MPLRASGLYAPEDCRLEPARERRQVPRVPRRQRRQLCAQPDPFKS